MTVCHDPIFHRGRRSVLILIRISDRVAPMGNPKGILVAKPRVARNELPWEFARAAIYPEGVVWLQGATR